MENTSSKILTEGFDTIETEAGYKRVLDYVDLFDEGRFGSDKLFLRGSFLTLKDVHDQVNAFLTSSAEGESVYGTPSKAREIADYNRLFEPNRRIWKLSERYTGVDPYPYRAEYRLLFFVKLHFNLDFAYIWFGIPWTEDNTPKPGEELEPINSISINDLVVLKHTWISKEDADTVLSYIKTLGSDDAGTSMASTLSAISGTPVTF